MEEENKNTNSARQCLSKFIPSVGIVLGMLAGASYGLRYVLTKFIYHINPFTQMFIGGLCGSAFVLPMCIYLRQPITAGANRNTAFFAFLATLSSASVTLFVVSAVKYISVADTISIKATSVALVALMSICFFGEKCKFVHFVTVTLSVVGSFVTCKPSVIFGNPWSSDSVTNIIFGVLLAFGSAVCKTLHAIFTKKLVNDKFPWCTLSLYTFLCLALLSVVILLIQNALYITYGKTEGFVIIGCAILTVVSLVSLVIGLRKESARNVAVAQAIELPVVILLEFFILGTKPDWNTYVGSLLVIAAIILAWAYEWWKNKNVSNP